MGNKVYCNHCQSLGLSDRSDRSCSSDGNKGNWYDPEHSKLSAKDLNKNNDCPYYKDRRRKEDDTD